MVDQFARFMKWLVLIGSALAVIMSINYNAREGIERFEFPVLILFASLGMLLMVSANDLISLYVGLELQSLSLYVIAAFRRDSAKSSEAGLKYFVLGALSSGMLLYGASMIYGFSGTTRFDACPTCLLGQARTLVSALLWVLCSFSRVLHSRFRLSRSTCGRLMCTKVRRRPSQLFLRSRLRSQLLRCLFGL